MCFETITFIYLIVVAILESNAKMTTRPTLVNALICLVLLDTGKECISFFISAHILIDRFWCRGCYNFLAILDQFENIESLAKLQKRAARIIFNTPSAFMFKELGWLSVADSLNSIKQF